jgi:hypothetical protein
MNFLPLIEPNPTDSLTEAKVSLQIDAKSVIKMIMMIKTIIIMIIIHQSLCRPFGMQEVVAPRISRQQAHEGGKFVSCMRQPLLAP